MLYVKWLPRELPMPLFGHCFETFRGYAAETVSEGRLEITRYDVGGATHYLDGQVFNSRPGDITVWPPHTRMHIETPPHHVHTTVSFAVEACEIVDEAQAREFVTEHGGIARNNGVDYFLLPLYLPEASSAACDLLGRTMAAVRSGETTSRLRSSGLFLLLCEELTGIAVRQLAVPGATPTHVDHCRHALEYVAAHYREPFTTEALARAVGLTPNYLCTLFKRTVGVTPVQYITQYRIAVAKELLLSTALPVCDVAAAVGFDDAAYFCRVFKSSEKLSPKQWRNGK